jgi:hypothetical protein
VGENEKEGKRAVSALTLGTVSTGTLGRGGRAVEETAWVLVNHSIKSRKHLKMSRRKIEVMRSRTVDEEDVKEGEEGDCPKEPRVGSCGAAFCCASVERLHSNSTKKYGKKKKKDRSKQKTRQ